jgi:hypothetical protein
MSRIANLSPLCEVLLVSQKDIAGFLFVKAPPVPATEPRNQRQRVYMVLWE